MLKSITIAVALMSTAVHATELRGSIDSEVAGGSTDWSGAYVGVGVGYGEYSDTDGRFPPDDNKSGGDDIGFSVHAGYNYQLDNNVVVGVEADYLKLDSTFNKLPASFPITDIRVTDVSSLRAKLGYSYGDFLPYISAGMGYARLNLDGTDGDRMDGTGWTAGVGVDYKINEMLSFGMLYQHQEYSKFADEPIEAKFDLFTARLSAHF